MQVLWRPPISLGNSPTRMVPVLLGVVASLTANNVSIPTVTLASGTSMPVISIGTGGGREQDAYKIVSDWLTIGGRAIDTALIYHDQASVSKAIADAGLTRADVFLTSKIPECGADPNLAEMAIKKDLKLLGTDYIDLMLIHTPMGTNCRVTWHVLETLHKQGTLKAIGVSNCMCTPRLEHPTSNPCHITRCCC